jgi:hypothetical protein
MDWIKRNYDQFILGLVALLVLAEALFLIYLCIGFPDTFTVIKTKPYPNNNVPELATDEMRQANDSLKNPAKWQPDEDAASIFVSRAYVLANGNLIELDDRKAPPIHPPVPNTWILDHHLDILDTNVLSEDPDGDGFTNLDEWRGVKGDGSDSTDPWDPKSHPPYYTKLFLIQYVRQPFRLLFAAYDGDVAHPDKMDFEINTIDINQPTQFVKIGDIIAGTKFKVIKFEYKSETDSATGDKTDTSELTLQNTETGDSVLLVLNKISNSPDSYAAFHYAWNDTNFEVKKGKVFALRPEDNLRYILIDITDDHALIQTPTGQQVTIHKQPQQ